MKHIILSFFVIIMNINSSTAQEPNFDQTFLFDEEDITVHSDIDNNQNDDRPLKKNSNEDISAAMNQAKNLLNQKPINLPKIEIPTQKITKKQRPQKQNLENLKEAPFGMFWGASQVATLDQGITLQRVALKDYENSFLASSLPKPIDFFNRIYAVFGKDDELYRILTYSTEINDNSSAQKILDEYNKYSNLLEKKYGNKQIFFTPAVVEKTIINAQNKEEKIKEDAPLGNPDFLNQLATGSAVLYSTYNNQDVAAALSISVDGEKKGYIVIDYKNLKILQKQENATLDAL